MTTPSRRSLLAGAAWVSPAVVVAGASPAFARSLAPASSYVMTWNDSLRIGAPAGIAGSAGPNDYRTAWQPTKASGVTQSGLEVVVERRFVGSVARVQVAIIRDGRYELRQTRPGNAAAQSHLDRSCTTVKFLQDGVPRQVRNLTFRVIDLDSLYRGSESETQYALEQMEISAYPGAGSQPVGVTTTARGANIAGSGTWDNPWRNTGTRYGGVTSPPGTNTLPDAEAWFDVRVSGALTEVTLEHWASNSWTWRGVNLQQQYEARLGALSFDLD